nr:MAG TPA: hypothetical protein [Bacteriophage sp.]
MKDRPESCWLGALKEARLQRHSRIKEGDYAG